MMTRFAGLEKIAPDIIKFPFVETFKAIINLKLHRKIASSIAKICALIVGLTIGYIFPEIGSFMSFFINLFITNPVNAAVLNTITLATSMVLSASVLMFVTKKLFNYYNTQKYGVSNSELRLTERDRKILVLKFTDDGLPKEKINKRIQQIEDRINFLVNKITLYKLSNDNDLKVTAKVALNGLKRGDISFFLVNYEVDFARHNKRMRDLKKFKKGNPDIDMTNFDNYDDDKYELQSASTESTKSSDNDKDDRFAAQGFNDDFEVLEDSAFNNSYKKNKSSSSDSLSDSSSDDTEEHNYRAKHRSKHSHSRKSSLLHVESDQRHHSPHQNSNTVNLTVNLYGMKKGESGIEIETSTPRTETEQEREISKISIK